MTAAEKKIGTAGDTPGLPAPLLPEVHLDHAAAPPPLAEIPAIQAALWRSWHVNPHGTTRYAEAVRRAIRAAEQRLLRAVEIPPESADVIWTSGGTEAVNLACRGPLATLPRGRAVLVDAGAHAAMLEACARGAADHDLHCVPLPLDQRGRLRLPEPPVSFPGRVSLAAVCLVNNETGAVCDLPRLRQWLDRTSPGVLLAVDAVQALGKMPLPWTAPRVDMLCLSGRKIGGPTAVGALVVRRDTRLGPLLVGGSQQKGRRAGTVDVPGVLAFTRAAEIVAERRQKKEDLLRRLRRELQTGLAELEIGKPVVLSPEDGCPAIFCVAFPGYEGAVLTRLLAERGVLVAAGSACRAESGRPSHVLAAMGIGESRARGALRVSFGETNTVEDIRRFLAELQTVLKQY